MSEDVVTFAYGGDYEGNAMKIFERRNGEIRYIWHGYFDGKNTVRIYPKRPHGVSRDGITRKARSLNVFDIERIK